MLETLPRYLIRMGKQSRLVQYPDFWDIISYPISFQEMDIISYQYPKNRKDIYQISYILIKYEAQSKPVLTKNFIAPRNHFHLSTT